MANNDVTRFRYSNNLPVTGINFPGGGEAILNPGSIIAIAKVFLEVPQIKTMIENGYLIEVQPETPEIVNTVIDDDTLTQKEE